MPNIFRNTDHDQGAGRPTEAETELQDAQDQYRSEVAHGLPSRETQERLLHAQDSAAQDVVTDESRANRRSGGSGW
jgi:hypothetical protein